MIWRMWYLLTLGDKAAETLLKSFKSLLASDQKISKRQFLDFKPKSICLQSPLSFKLQKC